MINVLLNLLIGVPAEWAVLLMAMLPIVELRGALPLALTYYHLDIFPAYFLSVVGNLLPVIFILLFIGPLSDWLIKNVPGFDKFFTWLFKRTRNKIAKQYERYGLLALIIFVATPLPMTGAWTGALAAWLFGIKNDRAFLAIVLGVLIAGLIVLLATTGILNLLF